MQILTYHQTTDYHDLRGESDYYTDETIILK